MKALTLTGYDGPASLKFAEVARWGTHADYVALPATTLALKPKGLSDVDAGSLPIAGLSAYAGLVATAGTANVEFVRSLGADWVIDYTKGDFTGAIKDCDVVFDLIGGDVRFGSFPVLRSGGAVVHISVPPMMQQPPRSDVAVKPAPVKYDTALLDKITAMVQSKAIEPVVTQVFAFADALKAFEHVMTGHARGKVMLDMNS